MVGNAKVRITISRGAFIAVLLLMALFGFGGCENKDSLDEGLFTVLVWNVQTMFDGEEEGNEYRDFRETSGWNSEKYEARLLSLGEAIIHMRPMAQPLAEEKNTVPDFIGLVELENAQVLENLVQGPLSKYGYTETFFANLPGAPLGLGVISRFPLTEARAHSISLDRETDPRPVLEVHIEPWGEPLVFFICHWKSKVGGEDATETLRRASARVIRRRLKELREEKSDVPVIVMGDLNENFDGFYRRQSRIITSLLPDSPEAADLVVAEAALSAGISEGYLVLSMEKPPQARYFDSSIPVLYSPWGNELNDGSYFFRDNWETIDHFLLSAELFNGQGWDYETSLVLNSSPFTNSSGRPYSYNPRTGRGLSDHLPLILFLRSN